MDQQELPVDHISRLPEGCLALLLSFTTPRDSAVSPAFLSAAQSDLVWVGFLPRDFRDILRRSSTPVATPSMRELYFRLCDSILIDGDDKMLWLEKPTGKKCGMLSARALGIIWGQDTRYWRWVSVPDARFPEVAELKQVCWLEITARISSRYLSPGTTYTAYLVMRLSDAPYGLDEPPQETEISVGGVQSSVRRIRLQERSTPLHEPWRGRRGRRAPTPHEVGAQSRRPPGEQDGACLPRPRADGWMEVEMGDFFVEEGGVEEAVDVRLRGWQRLHW
ncbi:hypothetical protein Taro_010494 [Colocasia esculenta]|uniref:Uncharacterized protein n=1 Tax=Colocasia esculenta TaxID=4460 RepID=A0A843U7R6_COLES|nr:hypothetical protein [Colocasia esculenta]